MLWILVAAAFVARLALLIVRPLWHDEIFTLWASRLPSSRLLEVLRQDSGPPLFYLVEKPFVRLAEMAQSDALARLLPFAAVLCLFVPARRLSRESARIWFVVLAAGSPLLLVSAGEARAYGLLALLDFALFFLLFRGEPSRGRLAGAAALTALALWTHYLAILFVAACALLLIVRRRFLCLAALCVGMLAFLPWIPVLTVQPRQATSWMREPLGDSLLAFVSSLGGAGRIPSPQGGPLPGILVTIGLLVAIALLVAVARAGRQDPESADAAALSLLTMLLVLAASLLRPVAFAGRSEIAILPIWLWSVSRAATAGRMARWVTAASVAVGAVAALLLMAAPKPVPSSSRAVALVRQLATREDRVIATAAFYLPARLAYDRGTLAAPVTPIPRELASHPGWFAQAPLSREDLQALDQALATFSGNRRAFLLLHPFFLTPEMVQRLAGRGRSEVLFERPDALVIVWTSGPASALPKGAPSSPAKDKRTLGRSSEESGDPSRVIGQGKRLLSERSPGATFRRAAATALRASRVAGST